MQDQIHIGPNLRRASSVTLEPNQVTDVQSYVDHLWASLADPDAVTYPVGTLVGAFLAANCNFGWFNVLMASIHETHARHRERGEGAAWELLRLPKPTHVPGTSSTIRRLPLIGSVMGAAAGGRTAHLRPALE